MVRYHLRLGLGDGKESLLEHLGDTAMQYLPSIARIFATLCDF